MVCAKMVAQLAPAMPHLKTKMNNNSKPILINALIIKNHKGVRLSPSARMMFDNRLNAIGASIPPSIICKNVRASAMISVGVCINNKIWSTKINDRIVKMIPTIRLTTILIAKLRRTALKSRAPKCWAVNMDKPAVNPCAKPMIKN